MATDREHQSFFFQSGIGLAEIIVRACLGKRSKLPKVFEVALYLGTSGSHCIKGVQRYGVEPGNLDQKRILQLSGTKSQQCQSEQC